MMDAPASRRRLGRLVKQQRQNLGLSVRAAAQKAGVDRATWTSLEAGSRDTQDRQFVGIERALEMPRGTIAAILRGEPIQLAYPASLETSRNEPVFDGTLGELIAARRNQLLLTYEQLSAQAATQGHEIDSRTLAQLANDTPMEYPGPATLRAVAAAMDLSIIDVQRAAVRSAPLWQAPVRDYRIDAWVDLVGDLNPAEIDHVLDVARAVVRALKGEQATSTGDDAATQTTQLSPESS
jgi:transcriptional regulator with XRE-family HTH domain